MQYEQIPIALTRLPNGKATMQYMLNARKNMHIDEYAQSVAHCVEYALNNGGGGANTLASLLLASYNEDVFNFNVVGLNNLDVVNFLHAMNIIKGRYTQSYEPHGVIDDGQEKFYQLMDKYPHLHKDYKADEE
jgi:hypothetical protein